MTREEIIERLRGEGGTPAELAARVGLDAQGSSFKRALAAMVQAGELIAEGSTSARTYRPVEAVKEEPSAEQPEPGDVDRELLAIVPCTAREFSDAGNALGLKGRTLHERKIALGLATMREGSGGRWIVDRAGGM